MHAIPVRLAEWEQHPGERLSVFRTSTGRFALQRGSGPQEVFDSLDELRGHAPAALMRLVDERLATTAG